MNTAIVKAKVDPELKKQAEEILDTIGLTTSRAITLLFHQIVLQRGLPIDLFIPNEETLKATNNAKKGRNICVSKSPEEFFKTLKEASCTQPSTKKKSLKTTTPNSSAQART